MSKQAKTDKRILDTIEMFGTAEPDISTERLFAMAADRCRVSYERVVDALYRESKRGQP